MEGNIVPVWKNLQSAGEINNRTNDSCNKLKCCQSYKQSIMGTEKHIVHLIKSSIMKEEALKVAEDLDRLREDRNDKSKDG